MTEKEKTRKELRKVVRAVFMKYKREGLWKSNGEYIYTYNYFRLPFSITYKEKQYNRNYVHFNYTNGSIIIRTDPQLFYDMSLTEYDNLSAKINEITKEMYGATALWSAFFRKKFCSRS